MSQLPIKPSDFNSNRPFRGTVWKRSEIETVGRNIVIMSQRNGGIWSPFSWEEYVLRCDHQASSDEHAVLDTMTKDGYLDLDGDGKYSVNLKFLAALAEYVKV